MQFKHSAAALFVIGSLPFNMTPAAASSLTTVSFYANFGLPISAGSFTYDSSDTGLLTYNDLESFSLDIEGSHYDLSYVLSGGFSQYYYLGFNASSKSFVSASVGGVQQILSAIKSDFSSGFFIRADDFKALHNYAPGGTEQWFSTFSYTVTSTVTNVPLPASAPMFGVAFLALGAIGYRSKRKADAEA